MTSNSETHGKPQQERQSLSDLLLQMRSPDPDERFEAVAELALRPPSAEVDKALIDGTSDVDPDVVAAAMDGLAERGHPIARELIVELLHHAHSRVRFRAIRSAGVVDIGPDLEAAWSALDDRRWVDRTAGAAALARAGVVSALPRIRALAERARAVRHYAAEAHLLGAASLLGDAASAESFLERLRARARESRLSAAAFLGRRGRVEGMARIVGTDRLRSALLAGRQVQLASPKPGYAREFDKVLSYLDGLP